MTLLTQRLSSHPQPYTGFGVVGTTREVEVQRVAALVAEADRQWMARRVLTGRLTTPLTMNQMIQIKWTAIRSYEVGCYAHLGCDHLALALSPRAGGILPVPGRVYRWAAFLSWLHQHFIKALTPVTAILQAGFDSL